MCSVLSFQGASVHCVVETWSWEWVSLGRQECVCSLLMSWQIRTQRGSRSGCHSQDLPPRTHFYHLDHMTQILHTLPKLYHQLGTKISNRSLFRIREIKMNWLYSYSYFYSQVIIKNDLILQKLDTLETIPQKRAQTASIPSIPPCYLFFYFSVNRLPWRKTWNSLFIVMQTLQKKHRPHWVQELLMHRISNDDSKRLRNRSLCDQCW